MSTAIRLANGVSHAPPQTQPPTSFSMADLDRMATWVVESRLFAVPTKQAAATLMLLCQAEGLHPINALRRYHIIEGRPSMRADAMLAEFQRQGGRVEWAERTDMRVEATFEHNSGGCVTVAWTMADANRAGLAGRGNWNKYPRQMLTARVISEGVRTVLPGVVAGVYTPEEVADFDGLRRPTRQHETTPTSDYDDVIDITEDDGGVTVHTLETLPRPSRETNVRWEKWIGKLMDRWAETEPLPDPDEDDDATRKEITSREHRIAHDLVSQAIARDTGWRLDPETVNKVDASGKVLPARDTKRTWIAVHGLAALDWDWVKATTSDHVRKFVVPLTDAPASSQPEDPAMTDAEARLSYGPGAS